MNNAEMLMKTANEAGIKICFSNFGTTEIPLTTAFDTMPGIRPVMCLFEGVCAGAADGWGRMTGKPAMTLLHLGPGLANGLSTLHDARRAGTPLFNVVGEHTSWHVQADPPLAMNIEALAGTVSGWQHTVRAPEELAKDIASAIDATRYGQISTLIIPTDFQRAEARPGQTPAYHTDFEQIDSDKIQEAVKILTSGQKVGMLMGGKALGSKGLRIAARIQARSRCDLLASTFPPCLERGGSLPEVKRLPYFADSEAAFLQNYDSLVIAGASLPVAFFAETGIDSYLGTRKKPIAQISGARQNVIEALEHLADAIKAPVQMKENVVSNVDPRISPGKLNAQSACSTLAAVQPEGAIIVDEGISSAMPYFSASRNSPAHTLLTIVGGALGYGMPCSTGAALACPDRPVINYQADGSAMYTVQALWTQARENLNITTLIASNRIYDILRIEMDRAKVKPGPKAMSLMELKNPDINWVKLAESLGVAARSVETTIDLADEIRRSLEEKGPHLIEMVFE